MLSFNNKLFGVPRWLFYLEDRIIKNLNVEYAKNFQFDIPKTIPIDFDFDKVKNLILIFILEYTLDNFNVEMFKDVFDAINETISLLKNNCKYEKIEYSYVYDKAYSVSESYSGCCGRDYTTKAASKAAKAAYKAASDYCECVSDAANACAESIAYHAKNDDYFSRRNVEKYYKKLSDKLIELLKECK